MTWKIKPLKGKYYGTEIENSQTGELIVVWLALKENYRASDREIAEGWEEEHGYDHVEIQRSYEAAIIIADALNEKLK